METYRVTGLIILSVDSVVIKTNIKSQHEMEQKT